LRQSIRFEFDAADNVFGHAL